MNVSAIIAEYNPFHKGHLYHIKKTKELTKCDGIICIMSGNFVQRGLPSIVDKWSRTTMALKNGIDLVIELPVVYSLASAEFFSYGSISLINSLNIVNTLSFGSELGDITILERIAEVLLEEPVQYKKLLSFYLEQGLSFPKARSNALESFIKSNNIPIENLSVILNSSNNILGIEYLKSLLKLESNIKPLTIERLGESYNSKNIAEISSATAIRKFIFSNNSIKDLKDLLPLETFHILTNYGEENFPLEGDILPYLKHKIYTNRNCLLKIPDVKEGIENKIIYEILRSDDFSYILNNIKSKRYTLTRIHRILMQLFLGFENYPIEDMRKSKAPYARILGFNSKGQEMLKEIKKKSMIPIITKIPKEKNDFLKLDLDSTAFYGLLNKSINYNEDFYRKPIIIK